MHGNTRRRSQRRGPGGPLPSTWNATNAKNATKKTIVSSVLVSFNIFAYNSTRIQQ